MSWPRVVSPDEEALVPAELPAALERLGGAAPLLLLGPGAEGLAHELAAYLLLRGERIVAADGAGAFSADRLVRAARRAGAPPAAVLPHVRVSRAFTWQQLVALLETDLGAEARRAGVGWGLVLGPLDLFADHDVKPWAAEAGARRAANALVALARGGVRVIAAQDERPLRAGARPGLLGILRGVCGETILADMVCGVGGRPALPVCVQEHARRADDDSLKVPPLVAAA